MKSLRNKVILSGIVLLFAFIATIGSTYAWFTVSTQTTVEALNLQVAASDNLLIRVKKLNDGTGGDYTYDNASDKLRSDFWSTSISNQNFLDAGYFFTNDDPWRLKPTTVVQDGYSAYDQTTLSYLNPLDTLNRGLIEIEDGVDTNDYNAYSGYYIKIQLYLLSLSDEAKFLELDKGITSITANHLETDDRRLIVNSVRLSVFSTGTQPGILYGYDNNYGFDFTDSEEENTTSGTVTSGPFNSLGDLALPISGLSTSVSDIDDTVSNPDIVTLTKDTPTLVTVLIYIEGWHVDAANYVVGANFNIAFAFKFGTEDL